MHIKAIGKQLGRPPKVPEDNTRGTEGEKKRNRIDIWNSKENIQSKQYQSQITRNGQLLDCHMLFCEERNEISKCDEVSTETFSCLVLSTQKSEFYLSILR